MQWSANSAIISWQLDLFIYGWMSPRHTQNMALQSGAEWLTKRQLISVGGTHLSGLLILHWFGYFDVLRRAQGGWRKLADAARTPSLWSQGRLQSWLKISKVRKRLRGGSVSNSFYLRERKWILTLPGGGSTPPKAKADWRFGDVLSWRSLKEMVTEHLANSLQKEKKQRKIIKEHEKIRELEVLFGRSLTTWPTLSGIRETEWLSMAAVLLYTWPLRG